MKRFHYAWIILAVGVLVVTGALGLARFGYSAILPFMQVSLKLDNTQAGALASANLLGYVAFSVAGGALASRFGHRVVITFGLALAGVAMIFTGMADGFLVALIWRLVAGVGSGASNVPIMGLPSAWFAPKRRGFASGIVASGSSIGLIVSGPLVPMFITTYGDDGWRLSWYVFGGVTLVLAVLSYLMLRNKPNDLGLTPYGAATDTVTPPAAGGGGLQWGLVYRSITVWHLGLVYIAFGYAYITYMTFFTKWLMEDGGYSKESAGALLMLIGWLSLFSGLIWGMISDSIGRKRALIIVYLIHAVAFAMFGLWGVPLGYTISAILFGVAAWSIPTIMSATCGDVLGPRLAPAALGFITMFFGLGQALGPTVAGMIRDASGTFAPAFILASLASLIGAGGSALLRPASTTVLETIPMTSATTNTK